MGLDMQHRRRCNDGLGKVRGKSSSLIHLLCISHPFSAASVVYSARTMASISVTLTPLPAEYVITCVASPSTVRHIGASTGNRRAACTGGSMLPLRDSGSRR
jgi:hypothetical protein